MAPNNDQLINESTSKVPRLEDYDISPLTGFLPSTPPLQRLPDSYYESWETLIDRFHDLMLTGRLREYVKKVRRKHWGTRS
jgi:indoleamine 2,3-dioxygenase